MAMNHIVSPINLVIVDYVSEKNRGDAAIHLGLLNILQKSYPNAVLAAISVFGANQFPEMEQEYDHSNILGMSVFGGLVPTFYPSTKRKKTALVFEVQNFISLFFRLWLLLALKLKIPVRFLKNVMSKKYQETLELIENADLIVMRGRNYRNRKTAVLEIFRMLSKIYHLLICSLLSKKMVLIGASVWDQKSSLAEKMLGFALKSCKFVTVRETFSLNAAKRIANIFNFPVPVLTPDLSFAAFDDRRNIILNRKRLSQGQYPEVIGLTIHDWKSEGQKTRDMYLKSISGLIDYYSELHSRIIVIPQVTIAWEHNTNIVNELQLNCRAGNLEIITGDPSVRELLHIYSNLDLLVATRMHSAIFAAAVNTPIVAISYDKGGKWNIIEELGYKTYLLNFDQLSPQLLIKKTIDCWQNKESLVNVAENRVEKNTENLQLLINLFASLKMKAN